ncbi:hypothetical protein RI367_002995 [Sorochytrium milnesiophthora]
MSFSFTEDTFMWSLNPFALGVTLTLDIATLLTAAELYRKTRSRIYSAMIGIVLVHIANMICSEASIVINDDGSITGGSVAQLVLSAVFSLACNASFTVTSFISFKNFAELRTPMLLRGLAGLTGLSVLLCMVTNLWYLGVYGSSSPLNTATVDQMFGAYSMIDALVNAAIAAAFVYGLHVWSASGKDVRKTFPKQYKQIQAVLGFESALVVVINVFVLSAPLLDPFWSSLHIVESIRLRLFCSFLQMLSRTLRDPSQPSTSGIASVTTKEAPRQADHTRSDI